MTSEDNLDPAQWRKQIDERIRNLEERNRQDDEYDSSSTSYTFRRHAEVLTVCDLLLELSAHAGIAESRFKHVFIQRFLYHLDCLYSEMSDLYKETASRMDDRTQHEIYTGEEPPHLFE
jgi:hypothetical protein